MLPLPIKKCFDTWFSAPNPEINCQIATIMGETPHIRTMKLYELTQEGHLVFVTSTDTRKWGDLQKNPRVSVCIFNPTFGQLMMEGSTTLLTHKDSPLEIKTYWQMLPAYWQNFYWAKTPPMIPPKTEIPDSFGVIIMKPESWESLEICHDDYLKSKREHFVWTGESWLNHDLSPV